MPNRSAIYRQRGQGPVNRWRTTAETFEEGSKPQIGKNCLNHCTKVWISDDVGSDVVLSSVTWVFFLENGFTINEEVLMSYTRLHLEMDDLFALS